MGPGDLVRINLPSRYAGLSHVDRLQGRIGIVMKVVATGTNWVMTRRAHVLVEGDVRQFDVKYLESVDEAR